jgi:hypothetical protein
MAHKSLNYYGLLTVLVLIPMLFWLAVWLLIKTIKWVLAGKSKEKNNRGKSMESKFKLPYRLDAEALAVSEYSILDLNYKLVRKYETLEEAEKFIAEANGLDRIEVREDMARHGRMLQEYRKNIDHKLKEMRAESIKQKSGWCWKDLPVEIKNRFPAPPERSKFSSDEEYEEAKDFWQGKIGRNIGIAVQQYKNRNKDH